MFWTNQYGDWMGEHFSNVDNLKYIEPEDRIWWWILSSRIMAANLLPFTTHGFIFHGLFEKNLYEDLGDVTKLVLTTSPHAQFFFNVVYRSILTVWASHDIETTLVAYASLEAMGGHLTVAHEQTSIFDAQGISFDTAIRFCRVHNITPQFNDSWCEDFRRYGYWPTTNPYLFPGSRSISYWEGENPWPGLDDYLFSSMRKK